MEEQENRLKSGAKTRRKEKRKIKQKNKKGR